MEKEALMKKVLPFIGVLLFSGNMIWAETDADFKPSTEILVVSGAVIVGGPMIGAEGDFSPVRHFIGTIDIIFPIAGLEDGLQLFVAGATIKGFLHPNNVGPYFAVGPLCFVYPEDKIMDSYFIAGVGYKAVIANLIVLDLSFSAPASSFFDASSNAVYWDYFSGRYTQQFTPGSSIKFALGFRL